MKERKKENAVSQKEEGRLGEKNEKKEAFLKIKNRQKL